MLVSWIYPISPARCPSTLTESTYTIDQRIERSAEFHVVPNVVKYIRCKDSSSDIPVIDRYNTTLSIAGLLYLVIPVLWLATERSTGMGLKNMAAWTNLPHGREIQHVTWI